jgi:hypothetical protein
MLKAVRVKRDGLEEWPAADQGSIWHDIAFVADRAGLRDALRQACRASLSFEAYWLTVRDWDHRRRYPGDSPTRVEARDMLLAVTNANNGVMTWLRKIYQTT